MKRTHVFRLLPTALVVLLSVGASPRPLGDLNALQDLGEVGRLRDWRVGQSSGYNKLSKAGHPTLAPERDAQGRYVLFERKGPGCVTRIWGSGLTGKLMVWIDDDTQPRLQAPWNQLAYSWWSYRSRAYAGKPELPHTAPFLPPLSDDSRGTQLLMVPMAFRKRCKIAMDRAPAGNHYCVDYVTAPDTPIRTFDPKSFSTDREPLRGVLKLWRDPGGQFPLGPDWQSRGGTSDLAAGESLTLVEASGAGQVRLLVVEFPVRNVRAGRALVLRGAWDGSDAPLLELPIGDLCGMGFGNGNPNLPAGVEGIPPNGIYKDILRFYCRLPMPFSKGGRLTITNESPRPIYGMRWKVAWEKLDGRARGYGRFAGFTRRLRLDKSVKSIDMLKLTGQGHVVGYNMAFWDADPKDGPGRWFAEAILDNEAKPRLRGSPLFDFNLGPRAYWHPGPIANVAGTTYHEYPNVHSHGRMAFYRYMLGDAVRFGKSCRLRLRRGEGPGHFAQADLTWLFYLEAGARRTWPALNRQDLPWPTTHSAAAIEAESLAATAEVSGGTVSRVPDRWGAYQFSGGSMLVYAAGQPGDMLGLRIPAPADGYYHLDLRQIGGPSFSTYRLWRLGREFGTPLAGCHASPGVAVREPPRSSGTWYLRKGDNLFHFVHTPESWQTFSLLGLDCFWLRPVSKRTNLVEAEYLTIVETKNCTAKPEPAGDPGLSGSGALSVRPTGTAASVTFTFPVDADRKKAMLLVGYEAEPGAGFEVLWDGQSKGRAVADAQAVPLRRRLAAVSLASVGKGKHRVTLRLVGQRPVTLDFLKLSSPTRIEAEALPRFAKGYPLRIEAAPDRPTEPSAGQNVALRVPTRTPTDPLLLGLPAMPRSGQFRLALWLTPEPAACRLQFKLNGKTLRESVEMKRQGSAFTPLDLGTVTLQKGQNVLSITSDTWFRLDALDIRRPK